MKARHAQRPPSSDVNEHRKENEHEAIVVPPQVPGFGNGASVHAGRAHGAALADEPLLLRCSLETAIIFTHNMEVGLVHPPVGLNLFVLSSIAAAPIGETIRGFLPFVVILLLVLCIIIFLPVLTLWLPDAVFGGRL